MSPFVNTAIDAARQACKVIVRFMDQLDKVEVTEKGKNDLVTQVDKMAETIIIDIIKKAYPQHGILAEESGKIDGNEYTWIIDPLDGTCNFVHGFPQFAVSIALQKGEHLEAGVIYDPVRNELFTASRGGGAYLNNHRIRTSQTKKLEHALIGTGFPVRDPQHIKPYLEVFAALLPQTADIRRAGAAALDLAYVAAGRLDGFWEATLKPWDMAAGALMITEAGGLIGDYQGEANFLTSGHVITGNPKIYKILLEVINHSLYANQ